MYWRLTALPAISRRIFPAPASRFGVSIDGRLQAVPFLPAARCCPPLWRGLQASVGACPESSTKRCRGKRELDHERHETHERENPRKGESATTVRPAPGVVPVSGLSGPILSRSCHSCFSWLLIVPGLPWTATTGWAQSTPSASCVPSGPLPPHPQPAAPSARRAYAFRPHRSARRHDVSRKDGQKCSLSRLARPRLPPHVTVPQRHRCKQHRFGNRTSVRRCPTARPGTGAPR